MLWRVRATLPDQPGALATLAQRCGQAQVDIRALQVFPGADDVTDELVVEVPDGWDVARLTELLESAGGRRLVISECDAAALGDQPTRYVEAARAVLAQPASFPDVAAHLFDAGVSVGAEGQDVMEMAVGDVQVQIRRTAPFTDIERARGAAMAELVSEVLGRDRPAFAPSSNRRMGSGATPEYVVADSTVTSLAEGVAVGVATLTRSLDEATLFELDIDVEPSWRRRGIGTRLLGDASRVARGLGGTEVLLSTASDNRAVMPMVLAAGMRGRIRMAGETLTVRIAVHELRPLP